MVTNTELTIDQITEEALLILKNSLGLGNRVLRQFDSSFGNEGAKIGDNLRVRVPVRYASTTGPAAAAQNFTETYKDVAAQTQRNIILNFSSKDLALAIDEFSDRVLEPAVTQLASDIDTDGTTVATVGYTVVNNQYVTANYAGSYAGFMGLTTPGAPSANGVLTPWTGADIGSGTIGAAGATPIANASAPFFQAQSRLTEQAAPAGERYCVVSPAAAASLQPNLFTNFNPSAQIGKMFQEGIIGMIAGADFYQSPSVQSFTSGNWTNQAAATNVAVTVATQGGTTLVVANVGVNAVVNSGDQFVVAGIFAVNPLTRQGNKLQVFTVAGQATANALGGVSLSVYPAMSNTGQYQTISAMPTAAQQVTFLGTSNTSTAANFMYNKNAIALVVAPLSEDLDGAKVSRTSSEADSLSIRYVSQYQASSDLVIKRLDILYGWAVVRPELGCLIKG